jgi:hypothetical protein
MALVVGYDGAKVDIGIAHVDDGWIAALDVNRWGVVVPEIVGVVGALI